MATVEVVGAAVAGVEAAEEVGAAAAGVEAEAEEALVAVPQEVGKNDETQ